MKKPFCTIGDCSKVQISREMCEAHYRRWYKYGNALHYPTMILCKGKGCKTRAKGNGYCMAHFRDLQAEERRRKKRELKEAKEGPKFQYGYE